MSVLGWSWGSERHTPTHTSPAGLWKSDVEQSERYVTAILYLNPGWAEADGGQLKCFLGCSPDDDAGQTATAVEEVVPAAGRLVLFRSAFAFAVASGSTAGTNYKEHIRAWTATMGTKGCIA